MARSIMDVLHDPKIIEKAKEELEERMKKEA